MERFLSLFRRTRAGYYADFAITPPVTAVLAWLSFEASAGWLAWFVAGLLVWSLYEYVAHRFVSHGLPLMRDAHWLHHSNQADYIAVPPLWTVFFYVLFWWLFGMASTPLAIGFSTGYVAYSSLHTAFHYARIGRGHPLYYLKFLHVTHHRRHDKNYGVVCPLWDVVFGTYEGPKR
jgi:sterol desaturase/sphingolipid hydroxylase (fatty acid hydroxylase superfamily)